MKPVLTSYGADDHSCLIWSYERPRPVVSSAPVGGGLTRTEWVVNAQVDAAYQRVDLARHGAEIGAELGLPGSGVVMFTAVDVADVSESASPGGLAVAATVGVTVPTWAAQEAAVSVPPEEAGTINIVAHLPVQLTESALVNAVITITEAKAQALLEAGIAGTGTATDAVCVVATVDGPVEEFAGPRSSIGAELARRVHGAVLAGLR